VCLPILWANFISQINPHPQKWLTIDRVPSSLECNQEFLKSYWTANISNSHRQLIRHQ